MSDEFESGFMLRQPSWHRKENAVLKTSPATWEDARQEAGLTWDVITEPTYRLQQTGDGMRWHRSNGHKGIYRDDKGFEDDAAELAIQKNSYAVIKNAEFGQIIDTVLGLDEDDMDDPDEDGYVEDPVEIEVLMSLYGGRQVVALIKFLNPLVMEWDPSRTFRYMCMSSRHDGQGGLRGIATNIRVVCANTLNWAEMVDGKRNGFTIKHTSNWEERVAEVRHNMIIARGESSKWLKFAGELAAWKATEDDREKWLKKLLPVSDDMTDKTAENMLGSRDSIREILVSKTTEHIADTGYGLLMASTEWNDHGRDFRDNDSYVTRQLLHKEPLKARSAKILLAMAKA
jgi:phage/plasmid-like protein (TIGR03299 family)